MADRYWVGGSGTWDTTSTTNWSASSGGAGGASRPTAADSVFFDQAGTYTVTMTGGLNCLDITVSAGTVTFAVGTGPSLSIAGSMSLIAGTVFNVSGLIFTAASTGKTVTTNGTLLNTTSITFNGGGAWTLGSALTTNGNLAVTLGSFNSAGYAISATQLSSNGTFTRSISLGSSTVSCSSSGATTLNFANVTNLTFNAGTSQINLTSGGTSGISSGGLTFHNVSFTSGSTSSITITGANTFNRLLFNGRTTATSPGVTAVTFSANQTISTLTLNSGTGAVYRTFLASDTIGTQRTLSVGTLASGAADYDFRDIAITGAAAPIAPPRAGDCKGNSGITFPAAKTVYWRQNSSSSWGTSGTGVWSLTNGGALDATAFPLAQDTAVFPSSPTAYPTSGNTVTINASYNIGTIDMSARTSATMTLAMGTTAILVFGNWINGTGITISGTGSLSFQGRGSQTITSAGRSFTQNVGTISPGGTVTLQDAFSTTSTTQSGMSAGTFDANGYNYTAIGFSSNNTGVRTIALGSGTWTLYGSVGNTWNTPTITNLTVTGTGTISLTSATAKSFAGGGIQTYPTLNQGGTGTLTISGSNKFAAMTNTAIGSVLFTGGTTNEFTSSFSLNGSAVSSLTLSSTNTTQAILKKPSAWLMGLLSTNAGNNTGLTFVASDGTMEYLTVSYINGQTTVTYTGAGNFFPFFS